MSEQTLKQEITNAKIKNGLFLYVVYDETTDKGKDSVKRDRDLPMHEDCHNAFRNLLPHLILICEQEKDSAGMKSLISNGVDKENEINDRYEISEFRIFGSGDGESVQLIGSKMLKSGKSVLLSAPKVRYDDAYRHSSDFAEAVETAKSEVWEYLNGKHAPLAQTTMNLDDDAFEGDNPDSDPVKNLKKMMKEKGVEMTVS